MGLGIYPCQPKWGPMAGSLEPRSAPVQALRPAPIAYTVGLRKVYGEGESQVLALCNVDIQLQAAEFTAIMGPSGSGKSTLLQCMAGLDHPTGGQVVVEGVDLGRLSPGRLTDLRRDRLGFVFQSFNLIPQLTALENLTLSERLGGARVDPAWLSHLTTAFGLTDRLHHRPAQLSGGQQQRVAVARALAHRPAIVFADEPTGNLDSRTGAEVLRLLRNAVAQTGQTVAMVTHDPVAAAYAHRVVFLRDGAVVAHLASPTAEAVLQRLAILEG
ncbi:ABC transporter ATP-binding protein [Pilimelia columellifera]|uniref:ABC transporter ATP-binding protein n=1 Tax=Pilimelia columellifera subsp. columellifera TaxID=706583 RepID=A0ABP6ACZ9_9ACTN